MKNSLRSINAQIFQIGDTITNTGPLALDLRAVRAQLDEAVGRGAVAPGTADALSQAVRDAEQELAAPAPKQSRLREIVSGMAALTSGVSASAGLVESVEAFTRTVTGAQ